MWHRKPVVAGAFYPADRRELSTLVDSYLQNAAQQSVKGRVLGVISPHAGYVYSGSVAAYAFNQLKNQNFDVAIILAPSHRARFDGASVIPAGEYATPLGAMTIDDTIGKILVEQNRFQFVQQVHEAEHSLEVQIPFLQTVNPTCSIVPVVVGTTELSVLHDVADSIYDVIQNDSRNIVVIISTDLSHYHPYDDATSIDAKFIDSLKSYDVKEISKICGTGKAEACGEGPIIAGLLLCAKLGAKKVDILHYANSGDTAGGKSQVVGYVSAAIVD